MASNCACKSGFTYFPDTQLNCRSDPFTVALSLNISVITQISYHPTNSSYALVSRTNATGNILSAVHINNGSITFPSNATGNQSYNGVQFSPFDGSVAIASSTTYMYVVRFNVSQGVMLNMARSFNMTDNVTLGQIAFSRNGDYVLAMKVGAIACFTLNYSTYSLTLVNNYVNATLTNSLAPVFYQPYRFLVQYNISSQVFVVSFSISPLQVITCDWQQLIGVIQSFSGLLS